MARTNLESFRLKERCSIKSSKRIFAREYVDFGIPFWRSKDVIDKSLGVFDNFDLYISKERFGEIADKFGSPRKNDLLISSVGNRAGQPYVVQDEGDFYFKDGNILWVSEFENLDPEFLAYWLKSSNGQLTLSSIMIGSAQKALTIDALRNLEVSMPTYSAQLNAVKSLKLLDCKIALNRQINQTLEQMAQALFKSWFVDFDPVVDNALDAGFFEQDLEFSDELLCRAEARKAVRKSADFKPLPEDIRQLFPAAFEECSEPSLGLGGWVPEGWGVSSVVSRFKLVNGFPFKSENYVNGGEFGIVTIKNVQDGKFVDVCSNTINFIPNKMNDDCNLSTGDVIMSLTGNVGRVCLAGRGKYLLNQRVVKIKGKYGVSNAFVYAFFREKIFFERMLAIAKGTAQQNLSPVETGALLITLPEIDILSKISKYFDTNYFKYLSLMEESDSLAKLRDTLLPKLISGELQLDEIEADLIKEGIA